MTIKSAATRLTLPPSLSVRVFQFFQSLSALPSPMLTIGYMIIRRRAWSERSSAFVPGAGIRLQKTTTLTNPLSWADISSTLGNSSYSEPLTATPTYYRLYRP